MSSKRTPGKWELENIKSSDKHTLVYRRIKAKSKVIGFAGVYDQKDKQEAKANAEFIVKACNNHDSLVSALKWANSFIINYGNERHLSEHPSQCSHCELLEEIGQALEGV